MFHQERTGIVHKIHQECEAYLWFGRAPDARLLPVPKCLQAYWMYAYFRSSGKRSAFSESRLLAASAVLQSFRVRRILFCLQNTSTAYCSSSKERKRTPTSILPPPSPVWIGGLLCACAVTRTHYRACAPGFRARVDPPVYARVEMLFGTRADHPGTQWLLGGCVPGPPGSIDTPFNFLSANGNKTQLAFPRSI